MTQAELAKIKQSVKDLDDEAACMLAGTIDNYVDDDGPLTVRDIARLANELIKALEEGGVK